MARGHSAEIFRRRRLAGLVALALPAFVVGVIAGAGAASNAGGTHPPARVGVAVAGVARAYAHAEATRGWRRYRGPVPILMYHHLENARGRVPAGLGVQDVTPALFRAQMRMLRRHGYRAVTLRQVDAAWRDGGRLPPRPIVLTFDDGYRSQYQVALPTLRRMGWPGVMNLLVSNLKIEEGIKAAEVRRMLAAGWELAAHTLTHRNLTLLTGAALRNEVAGSRRALEREFHVRVLDFCYPGGRYDAAVIAAVRRAGYRLATAVNPGFATRTEPFALNRIRVDQSDTPRVLARTLRNHGVPL